MKKLILLTEASAPVTNSVLCNRMGPLGFDFDWEEYWLSTGITIAFLVLWYIFKDEEKICAEMLINYSE